jgi:itaconate CoA-transferase
MRQDAPRSRPLTGVRVLSFEHAVAAPFATRQLADLGATVVKVERPGRGDFARGYDAAVDGMSSFFVWLNRGKQSIALNTKGPGASGVVARLLDDTDVVLHNLSPEAARRQGLDATQVTAARDRLIAVSISGYGEGGPYSGRKAYDLLVQAEAGLLSVTGTEQTPAKVGASVADIAAGMYAFTAVLTALYDRERTGRGTAVDVAMLDALAEWMGAQAQFAHHSGRRPTRTGAHHATIAPYGPYRAADGDAVFLAVQNDDEWQRLCTSVLQQPALAAEDRFTTNVGRVRDRTAMDAVLVPGLAALDTAELTARLDEHGIAWAYMRDVGELHDHPQLRTRGRWVATPSPVGPVDTLLPPAWAGGEAFVPGAVPAVGEHTREVLVRLGYADEDIEKLRDEGTIA